MYLFFKFCTANSYPSTRIIFLNFGFIQSSESLFLSIFYITIFTLFRKKWLQKTGSPKSRIEKCIFKNEREIDKADFTEFKYVGIYVIPYDYFLNDLSLFRLIWCYLLNALTFLIWDIYFNLQFRIVGKDWSEKNIIWIVIKKSAYFIFV